MPRNTIDTTKNRLEVLLGGIESGIIQLPDFQRDWRWTDTQVKSLLASVSMGIPIGAILTLESSDMLAPRAFAGTKNPTEEVQPQTLVLDGQQRLTALYQTTYSDGPTSVTAGRQATERHYYFDIEKCLDEEQEREDAIKSYTQSGNRDAQRIQYAAGLFPTKSIFKFRDWKHEYLKNHHDDARYRQIIDQFEDDVIRNFDYYDIPQIKMGRDTDLESICITFAKTNEKGTRLDAFEVITAKMKRQGLDLKQAWSRHKQVTNHYPVLAKIDPIHYLKAITLMHKGSAKRAEILALSADDFTMHAEAATRGFIEAAITLQQLAVNKPGDLVHVPQAITLAVILASPDFNVNTVGAKDRIASWYWTTLVNEAYVARSSDSAMAQDKAQLPAWVAGQRQREPETMAQAKLNRERLRTNTPPAIVRAIQSMMTLELTPIDWVKGSQMTNGTTQAQMHHIFPLKWCRDHDVPDAKANSAANLTLIDRETNQTISGKAPSKYLEEIRLKAGKISHERMNEMMESHLINRLHLQRDDFDAFHQERAKRISDLIGQHVR